MNNKGLKGSVFKRGSKYAVKFYTGKTLDGKRVSHQKCGFNTEAEAYAYLCELNKNYYTGNNNDYNSMLVSQLMTMWFENYVKNELATNTISGYKNNIYNHIIPAIGNYKLYDVKPMLINKFYNELATTKKLSTTSIIYIHRNLYSAFKYAVQMEFINKNIFETIKPPKKSDLEYTVLTINESKRLLEASKNTEIYIPIVLYCTLGLRRGEALGLTWNDFDIDNKILKIRRSGNRCKGGMKFSTLKTKTSCRNILLPDNVFNILIAEKKRQNDCKAYDTNYNINDVICCRLNGEWITTNFIDKAFKSLLKQNELPVIRLHDLRHTYTTLQINNGTNINAVSKTLGHSKISTTMDIYSHLTKSAEVECATSIDNMLF